MKEHSLAPQLLQPSVCLLLFWQFSLFTDSYAIRRTYHPSDIRSSPVRLCAWAVKTELYVSCYTFCLALPEFLSSPV